MPKMHSDVFPKTLSPSAAVRASIEDDDLDELYEDVVDSSKPQAMSLPRQT